ncbi:glycosyltransferase [Rossellomorea marisflavi]|uniref:Glycosyltransferase 2-like domain-containing protein n=1 Tax=Rossellomorea marisflavi TaxID=189381 RepID=A0A0M0GQB5_9BACI|nr:glycosyltransferase [Rossellomorea marisflavi]KON92029.1 hypothetical protein AF331_06095 [Rossellomorea marisflavi]
MKVSIIIPFYNCPYVDQAIRSAIHQTYPDIEVIVVDDGSTKFTEKINPYRHRIKYIRKSNGGTASALNEGLRHATGHYFAWLSSDDQFVADKIQKQVTFMQRNGSRLSYTAFKTVDSNNTIISEIRSAPMRHGTFKQRLLQGCPVNGCTVMAEISLMKQAGWFDEGYKFAQDYEMWCRLSLFTPMHYFDESLVLYRVHPGMGTARFAGGIANEAQQIQQTYSKLFQSPRRKK